MKIGIIGAGVMGEVITSSLLKKNVVSAEEIMLSDLEDARLEKIKEAYGTATTKDNLALVDFADIVIFSVKPQKAREMMERLHGGFREEQVIVSIMAGVSLDTLRRVTGHSALVRSMPNIPARIGEGMTVWMASGEVGDGMRMIVKMIFQAFGLETFVHDEDLIDAATAVSGTGPAYIFYVAELLMKAAMELGFSGGDAQRMAQQTFRGAMDLWRDLGVEPGELRRAVTSKGGTTAAALKSFERRNTQDIFIEAIRAAYIRAGQLREVADGKPDPAGENDEG